MKEVQLEFRHVSGVLKFVWVLSGFCSEVCSQGLAIKGVQFEVKQSHGPLLFLGLRLFLLHGNGLQWF